MTDLTPDTHDRANPADPPALAAPFLPADMAICERCLTTWTYRSNDAPTTCPECGAEGLIPPEGNDSD